MECGLIAIEFIADLNVDEVRKGQLLVLTLGLPLALIVQLVLLIAL
jgi:hypothetical protein